MSTWTPADIGDYDQFLAGADTQVDALVAALRAVTAERGERQALADICLLVSERTPAGITGLLMAALRRLASEEAGQ